MSGGSYNYLCFKDASDVNVHDLGRMADRLTELGYDDISEQARSIIQAYDDINKMLYSLSGVFKAVEWMDSGDSGLDRVEKEIEKYRAEPF